MFLLVKKFIIIIYNNLYKGKLGYIKKNLNIYKKYIRNFI